MLTALMVHFLLYSKVPIYQSTENLIVVEDDDICTGEAYAPPPVPQTGSPSCITSVLREQLKKPACLSTLLLTERLITQLLVAPLYHGFKRDDHRGAAIVVPQHSITYQSQQT